MKGYKEWLTEDNISFITNSFGRILYVNANYPEGQYEKWTGGERKNIMKNIRDRCKLTREFNLEELALELL